MTAAIQAILALIEEVLPLVTSGANSALINGIIAALQQVLPLIVSEVTSLVPVVKNIIAALSANPATTADQLAALQALDAQSDAAFDAASADIEGSTAPGT